MAIAFLSLGALVMFGGTESPSVIGSIFAGQLINMYTESLGGWAYPLIGIAALATMFSTTLTCLDAYPRTLQESYCIWKNKGNPEFQRDASKTVYRTILFAAVVGTVTVFLIIKNVPGAMGLIVTTATVVSFISTPIITYINFRVMHGNTPQETDRPNVLMTLWSRFGITIMTLFSLGYLWLIMTQ